MDKTSPSYIANLLNKNNKAVERAIQCLFANGYPNATPKEIDSFSYYLNWISSGHHLTDHHLENARKLCFVHIGTLVEQAKINLVNSI